MDLIAKLRTLSVRPSQSADLAFPMSGVIRGRNSSIAQLGADVPASDFSKLYNKFRWNWTHWHELGGANGTGDERDWATLFYDDLAIRDSLENMSMFTIQNEHLELQLRQMIRERYNIALRTYAHTDKIVQLIKDHSGDSAASPETKWMMLWRLRNAFATRYEMVKKSLTNTPAGDGFGVVRQSRSTTRPQGQVRSETFGAPVGSQTKAAGDHLVHTTGTQGQSQVDTKQTVKNQPSDSLPLVWKSGAWSIPTDEYQANHSYTSYNTSSDSVFSQETATDASQFTTPQQDNEISFLDKKLAVEEQFLQHQLFAFQIPYLRRLMDNEFDNIDDEIAKLQVGLTRSYLTSPFPGIVTAVYKDVGEAVAAGERVIRVENNDELLLVGRIHCRGAIYVGATAEIDTNHLYESNQSLKITGVKVVSIRGHDVDDDEWDIILSCKNPVGQNGRKILPINYHFDKGTTSLSITV